MPFRFKLMISICTAALFSFITVDYKDAKGVFDDPGQNCTPRRFRSLTFSYDSQYVAATSETGDAPAIQIWEIKSGKRAQLILLKHIDTENAITFSSDDKYLAVSSYDSVNKHLEIEVWDIADKEKLSGFGYETRQIGGIGMIFSPDGHFLFSTDATGAIKWEIQTGKKVQVISKSATKGNYVSHSTRYLAQVDETFFTLWDTTSNSQLLHIDGPINTFAFSNDETRLFISTNVSLLIWDVATVSQIMNVNLLDLNDAVDAGEFSPNSDFLMTSTVEYHNPLRVWNLKKKGLAFIYPLIGFADPAQFSGDGNEILFVDSSRDTAPTFHALDAYSGHEQRRFNVGVIGQNDHRIAFSPNGDRLFQIKSGGILYVWNTLTGKYTIWC